ncbi:hypothetical protein [Leptospira haakeii]|uniref:Uncharacterized protein n=1 Tax=Leptospira haakeii TaxID=2023198 RepID=A0ABX4PFD5_9LEPT|nr:hypothetical protein [Leptospira haakeii]PKA14305.1 hypothetical protein CH363_19065 [Leptospira haakeii]PKA18163.1 hypothetical protein CH377_18820 [Leptospira haakeii]
MPIIIDDGKSKDEVIKEFISYVRGDETKRVVLGFDIYRYSSYEPDKQASITMLFNSLYISCINNLTKNHPLFNSVTRDEFMQLFISTGDGGYQILHTPIHALIVLFNFHNVIVQYHTNPNLREFRNFLGSIELRYVITIEDIYRINHFSYVNHYGKGIIKNARIMSQDKLNRLLIDEEVYRWFSDNILGIENIVSLKWKDLFNIKDFENYSLAEKIKGIEEFSPISTQEDNKDRQDEFVDCIPMRLEDLKTKDSSYVVYNIYLKTKFYNPNKETFRYTSIGNPNSNGLNT